MFKQAQEKIRSNINKEKKKINTLESITEELIKIKNKIKLY